MRINQIVNISAQEMLDPIVPSPFQTHTSETSYYFNPSIISITIIVEQGLPPQGGVLTRLEKIYEGLKNQFFDNAISLFIPQVFIFNYETGIIYLTCLTAMGCLSSNKAIRGLVKDESLKEPSSLTPLPILNPYTCYGILVSSWLTSIIDDKK